MATSRTRHVYGHRLRDQVFRTGTRCLPQSLSPTPTPLLATPNPIGTMHRLTPVLKSYLGRRPRVFVLDCTFGTPPPRMQARRQSCGGRFGLWC